MGFSRNFEVKSRLNKVTWAKHPKYMKFAKLVKESESELKMEFGDRWSHLCAFWVYAQITKICDFSKISIFEMLNFGQNYEFCQTKIFET